MIPQNTQNGRVGDKYESQTIAVSHDEKRLLRVIAMSVGLKTATAARQFLFRGLEGYLQDRGRLRGEMFETEVLVRLEQLIASDPELKRAAEAVDAHNAALKKKAVSKKPTLPVTSPPQSPGSEVFVENSGDVDPDNSKNDKNDDKERRRA